MGRRVPVFATIALVAACVTATPPPPSQPQTPATDERAAIRTVELYEMFKPSPAVKAECERLGFRPVPLIAPFHFLDRRNGFDRTRYATKIWQPDRRIKSPPDYGGSEKYGVPPGWTGLVLLDLEAPVWDPIRRARLHSDEEIEEATLTFLRVAQATRELRPEARIMFHDLAPGIAGDPRGNTARERIARASDAVNPALYVTRKKLESDMEVHARQVQACLRFKKEHGRAVYPVVWKRYLDGDRALMPPETFRRVVEVALLTELDGVRADGICLWGGDHLDPVLRANADESDLEAMRIIVEVAREREREDLAGAGAGAGSESGSGPG